MFGHVVYKLFFAFKNLKLFFKISDLVSLLFSENSVLKQTKKQKNISPTYRLLVYISNQILQKV